MAAKTKDIGGGRAAGKRASGHLERRAAVETDIMLSVVVATAQEVGVELISAAIDEPGEEVHGELAFQTQEISLEVLATSFTDILRFLSTLHDKVPVVRVDVIKLSGFGGTPSADVGLQFLLSPRPFEAEGE